MNDDLQAHDDQPTSQHELETEHPAIEEKRAPRTAGEERPRRRSFGRVLRIQPDALAWLADYRPLGREVMTRLNNPWQVNPGAILEYELRRAAGGRWQAADLIFNRRPGLHDLLALDEGRGLSPAGLEELLRLLAIDPGSVGLVFRGAGDRLRQQILDAGHFPLPRALLQAALGHPALAGRAARRLLAGPLDDAEATARLLTLASPRDETALLARIAAERPQWLRQRLPLPEDGLAARVSRWRKTTRDLRWLRQISAEQVEEAEALELLRAGAFGNVAGMDEEERAAWAHWLDAASRRRLLAAAFRDKGRAGLTEDPFAGLGREYRELLTSLAADPQWGEEARALLLERAELPPATALELLAKGARGEARERLLALLAAAPAAERPRPPAAPALEWFKEAATSTWPWRAGLLEWLGPLPEVQDCREAWLADPDKQALGLEALCHAPDFSHGLVQRLLGKELLPEMRARLAAAISRVNPERWGERYLANDAERETWRAAGAPLV